VHVKPFAEDPERFPQLVAVTDDAAKPVIKASDLRLLIFGAEHQKARLGRAR